ncbi:cyclic diguanylate phosphodiesterase [Pseudomonas palleroniana]|uniref:cyclic-guanylate-specific phosphodiesterase n=1 Tax=Pseudomonas palleroniana TaxID=191390 RepID=A0A1H5NWY4_9PSED|nr:EAL domain-containing protein [Pseudomonas palleroniana]KAB0569016.1 EAL domain-containing protein [Pseudomonas palleroniana]PTC22458.1 cyclic diguanylate phosphodiesterase [Pseudomonas palleroniana]SEF05894.1 EAL domain, c-di-GMP-specific phosphodiesterase class I (or its enzymatically inactive variant) [Pseudomonas palleroniana]
MPLTAKGPRSPTTRYLISGLSALLPILLGVPILHWQAERTLQKSTEQTAQEAVRQFDLMLDNTDLAAQALLPLAGQPCDNAVQLALREQVTRRPFVRATTLSFQRNIYCSSLFGSHYESPVNPEDYVAGRLWLMNGNPVTPNTALLVYRLTDGDKGAFASIDGYHLTNALRLISRYAGLILQVGPHWLAADGSVHTTPPPTFAVAHQHLVSQRYLYSVEAGMPDGEILRYMQERYPAVFSLVVFFGMLAGVLAHWLQKRSSAPTHELQRALGAHEFIAYYQPVVRGDTREWAGCEVLMRWQHPKEGLVRPDLFIPLAEHSGLIVPMTRALMRQVAAQLAPHAARFAPGFHIGVNITARHCEDLALVEDCRTFLAAFPPGQVILVLELTERELIQPTDITRRLFEALHELGVMIAIDDFGTGHSSLGYLRNFNVDYLKIDQSFVAMIGQDALSRHILDSIIELSGKLDLGIVAEGVETTEQCEYLAAQGVDFLQGYLFGRPLPGEEFIKSMRSH